MSSYKSTFFNSSITRQKLSQINQTSSKGVSFGGKSVGSKSQILGKKRSKNSFKDDAELKLSKSAEYKIYKENSGWLLSLELMNFIQSLCLGKLNSQAKLAVLELFMNSKNIKTKFDSELDKRIIEKYKHAQKSRGLVNKKSSPQLLSKSLPSNNFLVTSPLMTPITNTNTTTINNNTNSSFLNPSTSYNPAHSNIFNLSGSSSKTSPSPSPSPSPTPNSALSSSFLFSGIGQGSIKENCILTKNEANRAKLQAEFFKTRQHAMPQKFYQAAQQFYRGLITQESLINDNGENGLWPMSTTSANTKELSGKSSISKTKPMIILNDNKIIQNNSNSNDNDDKGINYTNEMSGTGSKDLAYSFEKEQDLPFKLDEDIAEENDDFIYSSDDNMDTNDEYGNYENCMDAQLYTYLKNKNIQSYY